jgi:hypothetical protein
MKASLSKSVSFRDLRQELVRDCDLLATARRLLLTCKSSYPHLYSHAHAYQLAAVERRRAVRLAQLCLIRSAEQRFKANFNPDQPRVPAGQPEGGRWTDMGSAVDDADAPANRDDAVRSATVSTSPSVAASGGRTPILVTNVLPGGRKTAVTIDYSRAMTGFSNIDGATKALCETLAESMSDVSFLPEWTPQIYGTAVHVDFGVRVRLQGVPGIASAEVEQSFFNKDTADYGDRGSVRTDVLLRNEVGDIIAIYDLKTGGAVGRKSNEGNNW